MCVAVFFLFLSLLERCGVKKKKKKRGEQVRRGLRVKVSLLTETERTRK